MHEFIKKLTKTLNNYQITARLMMIAGLITIITNILLFVCYQLSGGMQEGDAGVMVQITAFNDAKVVGMIYFLFAIVSIILGIAIVYAAMPYAFPKDKMNPNKALPWLHVANGALQFALMIMTIYLLATETSQMAVGFVIALIIGFIGVVCSLFFLFPGLRCRFYMPAFVDKKDK